MRRYKGSNAKPSEYLLSEKIGNKHHWRYRQKDRQKDRQHTKDNTWLLRRGMMSKLEESPCCNASTRLL